MASATVRFLMSTYSVAALPSSRDFILASAPSVYVLAAVAAAVAAAEAASALLTDAWPSNTTFHPSLATSAPSTTCPGAFVTPSARQTNVEFRYL